MFIPKVMTNEESKLYAQILVSSRTIKIAEGKAKAAELRLHKMRN